MYSLKQQIEYFKKVKADSSDYDSTISSQVIDDPVQKILHLTPNSAVAAWLKTAFYTYSREELYVLLCDKFLDGSFGTYTAVQICNNAIRSVLALAIEGTTSAPLEGIIDIYLGENSDKTQYLGIKYAGPIRGAGATGCNITVISAMYLSKKLNLCYKPEAVELERYLVETKQYVRLHPQVINPNDVQIEALIKNIPVCIDGVAAEPVLVDAHRYIPRVSTPYLRGGAILILCSLIIKAKKIVPYGKLTGLDLNFLLDILAKSNFTTGNSSFLDSIVAGRAVFTMPKPGGFRLRLGRARNTGLGTQGLAPATIYTLRFLNVGSQMMINTPGKANSIVPVTDLEGPFVELKNGNTLRLDLAAAMRERDNIAKIIDAGELLIAYGEYRECKVTLPLLDHSLDYWRIKYGAVPTLEYSELVQYCIQNKYMLVPTLSPLTYNYPVTHWLQLRTYFLEHGIKPQQEYICDIRIMQYLKFANIAYVKDDKFKVQHSVVLYHYLLLTHESIDISQCAEVYDILQKYNQFLIFPRKGYTYIGSRLASVEAASITKVGTGINLVYRIAGSRDIALQTLCETKHKQKVRGIAQICTFCNVLSLQRYCLTCKRRTLREGSELTEEHNFFHDLVEAAKAMRVNVTNYPITVTNKLDRSQHWEEFEKGILRAKYGLSTFKDGTIRFSVSNIALTHFKPSEIGLSIDKVLQLGYTVDIHNQPIISPLQIIPLKTTDVVLPTKFSKTVLDITKFLDELLHKYYGVTPYYMCRTISDLIGIRIVTIAPHILSGTCARIIGFMDQNAFYCHPLHIAARRRNADGDKDGFALLGDLLLNYSAKLLKIGNGKLMNIFSVITTQIHVDAVDKEVTNMDIVQQYPLSLYDPAMYKDPVHIKVVGQLSKQEAVEAGVYAYTTPTDTIVMPAAYNAYKDLISLEEKIDSQFALAKLAHSVDVGLVVSKVLEGHLIKDVIGNCRKFLRQNLRCTKCNIVYEIPPLTGICDKCKLLLNYTIHPSSATKYVHLLERYLKEYGPLLSPYLRDAIRITISEARDVIRVPSNVKAGFRKYI